MHGALFRGTPEPLGGRGEIAANALALEIQHGESELGFHMAVLGGGQPFFVGDGIGAVDLGDKFNAEIGPRGTLQPREGGQQNTPIRTADLPISQPWQRDAPAYPISDFGETLHPHHAGGMTVAPNGNFDEKL